MFVLLYYILIISSIATLVIAEVDSESYLWKQGLVQVATRGVSACTRTSELVERYKTFAIQSVNASKNQYRDTAYQAEKKIEHFKFAHRNYIQAEKHYKEALELLTKAKTMYETAKGSIMRAQDEQLPTYRVLASNQIKSADKIYHKAKDIILEGNRAFNQGIRYFNTGVDNFELETNEPLPKRYKFHRWPVEKLQ